MRPKVKQRSQLSRFRRMRSQIRLLRTKLRQTRKQFQGSKRNWTSPRRKMHDRALLSKSLLACPKRSHPSDSRKKRMWKKQRLERRPKLTLKPSPVQSSLQPPQHPKMPKSPRQMAPLRPAQQSKPRPRTQRRRMMLLPLSNLNKKLRLRRRSTRPSSAARLSLTLLRAWAPLAMSEF